MSGNLTVELLLPGGDRGGAGLEVVGAQPHRLLHHGGGGRGEAADGPGRGLQATVSQLTRGRDRHFPAGRRSTHTHLNSHLKGLSRCHVTRMMSSLLPEVWLVKIIAMSCAVSVSALPWKLSKTKTEALFCLLPSRGGGGWRWGQSGGEEEGVGLHIHTHTHTHTHVHSCDFFGVKVCNNVQ